MFASSTCTAGSSSHQAFRSLTILVNERISSFLLRPTDAQIKSVFNTFDTAHCVANGKLRKRHRPRTSPRRSRTCCPYAGVSWMQCSTDCSTSRLARSSTTNSVWQGFSQSVTPSVHVIGTENPACLLCCPVSPPSFSYSRLPNHGREKVLCRGGACSPLRLRSEDFTEMPST